jgi:hypothetical protein
LESLKNYLEYTFLKPHIVLNAPTPRPTWASAVLAPAGSEPHLSLSEAQRRRQLCSLGQCQVLSLLETSLKSRQLETGIDGAGFPDFLWLPVHYSDFRLEVFLLCNEMES